MLIYVRAPFDQGALEELKRLCGDVVYEPWSADGRRYYEDELLTKLQEIRPDALVTELDQVSAKVLDGYPHLQFIGDCRATPENVDTEACAVAGVPLLLTPGRNAQAVAEMLICLCIAALRHVVPAHGWAAEGRWVAGTTPYHLWMGEELAGKSVGFVGFGAVPRRAAPLFRAFGCRVAYHDPYVDSSLADSRSMEEIFAESDIVSLHLPVTSETTRLVGERLLGLMRPNSWLVNTARAAVVDTPALISALRAKAIRGAVLDVLDTEPPTADDAALIHEPGVLLTPHIAGASSQVVVHQSYIMVDAIREWVQSERNHE